MLDSLNTRLLNARDALRFWWRDRTATDELRRKTVTQLGVGGGTLALALGLGLYFWLRPIPQPDYMDDPLDDIFDYTLLTDEFNALPVEERMKLIGQLVQRLKNMDSGESVLLASFAAGVAGSARTQLQANASRLAIDLWDKYAKDYDVVKIEDREEYLEQAYIDMVKTMEALGGEPRDVSDAERINEVRAQAQRDREAMRNSENQPPAEAMGQVFSIMAKNLGSRANPAQRARGTQMMRDMVRHFRNQDVATGKPK